MVVRVNLIVSMKCSDIKKVPSFDGTFLARRPVEPRHLSQSTIILHEKILAIPPYGYTKIIVWTCVRKGTGQVEPRPAHSAGPTGYQTVSRTRGIQPPHASAHEIVYIFFNQ